jgi:hypothetical protein
MQERGQGGQYKWIGSVIRRGIGVRLVHLHLGYASLPRKLAVRKDDFISRFALTMRAWEIWRTTNSDDDMAAK